MTIEVKASRNWPGRTQVLWRSRPASSMTTILDLTPEDVEELRKALAPKGEDARNAAYRLGAYEDEQGRVWKLSGDGWRTYINGRGDVLVYRQHFDKRFEEESK